MAESILIIGESGSGKSTSARHLNPDETFWINVANKSLPFKGWKSKYPKFSNFKSRALKLKIVLLKQWTTLMKKDLKSRI